MSRELTPNSSLDNLKREAKRWLKALRANDVEARARLLRATPDAPAEPTLRDVQLALAHEHGVAGWTDLTRKLGVRASSSESHAERVATFLERAALDWRVGGSGRAFLTHDAGRILRHHPEIARENIYTAAVTGDVDQLRGILAERPAAASERGGPRNWTPLIYLANARLPDAASSERTLAIAEMLLDHGADPNAYYPGGNEKIRYTVLTGLLGRGEEQATTHPHARELVDLLMLRGAEPYDSQVLYNVFANHASRLRLGDDIVWLLEHMFAHSVRRGRVEDWWDPEWRMLDLGGYGHGAYYLLRAAVEKNLFGLAQWILSHGASANPPPPTHPRASKLTLTEEAMRQGHLAMASLLLRHGAPPADVAVTDLDAFIGACMLLDLETMRSLAAAHPEYLASPKPIRRAIEDDRVDVVEALLDLGMFPDVSDGSEGNSRPLHAAAYHGAVKIAQLLIDRGADIDFREQDYDAIPLGVASWANQRAMVQLLSRYSRDVWELTYVGAVERLREVLAESPRLAKVSSATHGTPLMFLPNDDAAALAITELFLSLGADPHARNEKGQTASEIARARGMDDVVELLEP